MTHDLGISGSCLRNWVAKADIDESRKDRTTSTEPAELMELRRKLRVAGDGEREPAEDGGYVARKNVLPKRRTQPSAARCSRGMISTTTCLLDQGNIEAISQNVDRQAASSTEATCPKEPDRAQSF